TDLRGPEEHDAMMARASSTENVMAVSAISGEGVDALVDRIADRLAGVLTETTITLSPEQLHLLPWLYEHALVDERRDLEDGSVSLDLRLAGGEAQRLESMLAE
ncbi:MAG: GTPase HflX, partial [Martelella sp.]